jgi:cytochrome c biogenesis protein CcmG/thiol:disulfide interchange protein DsbE
VSEFQSDDEVGQGVPQDHDALATRRKGMIILGVVAAVLVAVFGAGMAPKGKPVTGVLPANPAGFAAPPLELPSLNADGNLALSSFIGKPVVLNFWASWCTTCKDEAALLGEAERQWRASGVVFLGVDASDKQDSAKAFAKQYGLDYDSFFDAAGTVGPAWGVTGYPETFFIDTQGRIVSKFVSAIDANTLNNNIAAIAN